MSVSGGESYSCNEVASGTGKYTNSVCDAEGAGDFELQLSGKAGGGGYRHAEAGGEQRAGRLRGRKI